MNTTFSLPAYTDEELVRHSLSGLMDLLIGDEDRVPRNVIDECARRGEEMAERLRGPLEDDRYWKVEATPGEWWLLLHAIMILGLIPGERAGLLLVDFMRRMAREEEHDLQDWFAGCWPALFRNKPEAVLPALRALCEDRSLHWYIRTNAVDPVVAGARRAGGAALDEALAWVAKIAADEAEDWDMRLCSANTLLDFPRARYRPLLEELAARQAGFGVHFSKEDVQRAFSAMNDEPDWERFNDPWAFYTPAAIEGRQQRWAEEDTEPDEDEPEYEDAFMDEVEPPYVRPVAKIGRNDPCPCGSGKKYKKCCLLAGEIQDIAPQARKGDSIVSIYQIKVTLRHVHPPVWRRVQVPADIKLGELHEILQAAMGWTDSHLHAFRVGRTSYGVPQPEFPGDMKNERNVRLDRIAAEGGKLIYEYDFGDSWEHEIEVEKVLAAEKDKRYPTCLAGKRACPPEDCGGPWGYGHLLAVLRDPKHAEHEEMAEWIGEDFDPEAFDLDEVNWMLKRVR